MKYLIAEFESGWKVRVSEVDGVPFVTIKFDDNISCRAESYVAKKLPSGVALELWHPNEHGDEG